jgi:hypothetical protein
MRDDDSLRNEQKRQATNTSGIGKSLLNWLKPSSNPAADGPTGSANTLDRRTYMRLAGGAAAAATMGTAASATAAADSHSAGDRLNVTAEPYGANGDGSSDDTAAIQSAIDDASSGDTVYFPAGTYAVSGSETILLVDGDRHPDNITLEGDGPESVIEYTGGNGGSNYFMLRVRGGLSGFECHDLVLDGGYESVSGDPTAGLTLNQLGEDSGQSYHFENCVIRGGYNQGANVNGHGVSFLNCTVRENGGHGITFGPDTLVEDSQFLVDNCLVEDNTFLHSGHYGLDTARGNFLVRDTVIQNNGESATKIAGAGIDTDGKHLRVRIDNNGLHPFQAAPGYDNQAMTFEDVVVSNNGSYWRLNDPVDYSFNGEIVATNNGYDGTHSSVHLFSSATLDGEGATLWSNNNDGTGFNSDSDHSGNYIEEYNHADNAGGAVGSTDNLSFGERNEQEKTDLDVVPTADEVGAWVNGDSPAGSENAGSSSGDDGTSGSDDDGGSSADDGGSSGTDETGSSSDEDAGSGSDGSGDGETVTVPDIDLDPEDYDW